MPKGASSVRNSTLARPPAGTSTCFEAISLPFTTSATRFEAFSVPYPATVAYAMEEAARSGANELRQALLEPVGPS